MKQGKGTAGVRVCYWLHRRWIFQDLDERVEAVEQLRHDIIHLELHAEGKDRADIGSGFASHHSLQKCKTSIPRTINLQTRSVSACWRGGL
jgi:hypothetical protein